MNTNKPKTAFGQLLKFYRQRRELTQTELAIQLDQKGFYTSAAELDKYESGQELPPIQLPLLIAQAMGLSQHQVQALIDANMADYLLKQYEQASELRTQIPRFFISYSSKDERIVVKLAHSLEKARLEYWLDKKDILIGQPLLDRLREGVTKESDYTLIILSENSVASEWCKLELRMAYEKEMLLKRVVVLPIRIDKVDVPEEVQTKKYYQLDPSSKASLNALIKELKSLLRKQM